MGRNIMLYLLFALICSPVPPSWARESSHTYDENKTSVTSADTGQFHGYLQGFDMTLWMGNMGVVGINFDNSGFTPSGLGLEYPESSHIERLYAAGLWVGAIIDTSSSDTVKNIKTVTTGYEGWAGPLFEFYGNPDGSDSFYVTSIDRPNTHNHRFIDDDNDGKVDEDELNGIDDDHDGLIDEDYGAVSENDAYVAYADYYNSPLVTGHTSLGLKVWQRSFAWRDRVKEPILPFEFYIVNKGIKILDSVYVGVFADCDVGPTYVSGYYQRNSAGYFGDTRTMYTFNWYDRPSASFGISCLSVPRSWDSLRFTFRHYPGSEAPPTNETKYDFMSAGIVNPDEYPQISDTRMFFSFGPFCNFKPSDTLKLTFALIAGNTLVETPNNLHDNAAKALALYRRNFMQRPIPSSPPLHIAREQNKIILNWQWKPGDAGVNPLDAWDDMDEFLDSLPSTHWRRINPPAGHTKGGRTFEAFRVWRSESPSFKPNSFALLKQFDVADDLNLEIQTGLQYTLVDSNLNPEHQYWYAVTSVSIPEFDRVIVLRSGGGYDTLRLELTPPLESNLAENAIAISPSEAYHLHQSYPNPFNPKTTIAYYIPEASDVKLVVYDLLGRKIAELVNESEQAGLHEAEWDASGLASGVYFYKITAGSFQDVKKAVLIR